MRRPAQAQQQAEELSRQLAHANNELSAARVDSAQTAELLELLSDEQRASAQRLQELEQLLEDEIQDKVSALRPARMHGGRHACPARRTTCSLASRRSAPSERRSRRPRSGWVPCVPPVWCCAADAVEWVPIALQLRSEAAAAKRALECERQERAAAEDARRSEDPSEREARPPKGGGSEHAQLQEYKQVTRPLPPRPRALSSGPPARAQLSVTLKGFLERAGQREVELKTRVAELTDQLEQLVSARAALRCASRAESLARCGQSDDFAAMSESTRNLEASHRAHVRRRRRLPPRPWPAR